MLLFLDTEFTDLDHPELISIGLVSEDGAHAFYGEITRGHGWDSCSNFVTDEVLPLLCGGEFSMSTSDLKDRLFLWLQALPGAYTLAIDSQIDIELFRRLLDKEWPAKLHQKCYGLSHMLSTEKFSRAVIKCHQERGGKAHNAIDDAWANRAGWIAWRKDKQRPA